MAKGYRIFEVGPDGPRTLYHGHEGSRDVPMDTALFASDRRVWNPGAKTGPGYEEGFHVFRTREECERYITGFTRTDRTLAICEVDFACARPKPRSRSSVLLAKAMYVASKDWEEACATIG